MQRFFVKLAPPAILLCAAAAFGQTRQPCSILRALEGLRVELSSGEIMRLIGVQPFPSLPSGLSQITTFLDSLVIGKSTALEFDVNLPETFGYLWRDSVFVNVELLRRGWARIWEDTMSLKYQNIFSAAENEARQNKLGYWKFVAPIDGVTDANDDTVYVTKSGKKYHRANCRLLSQNKIALPLPQAQVDRGPCRLCIASASSAKGALSLQANGKTVTALCSAKTKNGERCKREAEAGSKYCWQHRRK